VLLQQRADAVPAPIVPAPTTPILFERRALRQQPSCIRCVHDCHQ
jgi:hypothetical protein